MDGTFDQLWENVIGRASGPMALRVLLQPTMAAFFAIRSGVKDAKEGRTPYAWAVAFDQGRRGGLIREGWRDVGKVFILASALDCVYQFIVFHRIYLLAAAFIAACLALVPYILIRGPANRLERRRLRSQRVGGQGRS
jgi:hypothetical protein